MKGGDFLSHHPVCNAKRSFHGVISIELHSLSSIIHNFHKQSSFRNFLARPSGSHSIFVHRLHTSGKQRGAAVAPRFVRAASYVARS